MGRPIAAQEPREFPVGTVTFLLTDVEGSSRVWEVDDDTSVESAVARFYEILDDVISRHGGVRPVEQGEGDSVVGVFRWASDAVAAAVEGQELLAAESWSTSEPLRIRMALHTGEAKLRDEGNYAGQAINRCARLRDLGHGGQVLVSRATHDLIADRLPKGVMVRDLGSHRLRDLSRPEHVFQVCHAELPHDFPPLRSLDSRPHNLPAQLTTFIGREQEMRALRELLGTDRLVTLTGSGGCGKTRLALHLAAGLLEGYPDGMWWVDLAALATPDLVPHAVGTAMGIRESPGEPFSATLERALAARRAMILLDNCEHLVEACAALCHVLVTSCPHVVIMATSREPLGVEGETTWRVPSLSLPKPTDGPAALIHSEAVRLFMDRARRARPTFEIIDQNASAVAQICQRLEGIPLAIELAAARMRLLSPDQIATGLNDCFRVLAGGARTALPRQRTLEASVDWSYSLLDEKQRTVFRRIAVFAGSFALDAAEVVCADDEVDGHEVFDLLLQLADRSLVQVQDGSSRYQLLETIRQYGLRKLADCGEADAVRARHLDHYTELAEHGGPLIEWGATLEWLERLDLELDNLRAASEWALARERAATGLRLAVACPHYWVIRGHFSEGRGRIENLLALCDPDPGLRARTLIALQFIAFAGTDFETVLRNGEHGLALAREIGSRSLEARALAQTGAMMAFANPESAADPLSKGLELAREAGDAFCANWASFYLGATRMVLGDTRGAINFLDEAIANARASKAPFNLAASLLWRGAVDWIRANLVEAEQKLREGRDVAASIGDEFWGRLIAEVLGMVLGLRGNPETGRALVEEGLRDAKETGNLFPLPNGLFCLAVVERVAGDVEATAKAAAEAAEMWGAMGSRWFLVQSQALLAWAEFQRGNDQGAATLLHEALTNADGLSAIGLVLYTQSLVARSQGEMTEAEDAARRCLVEVGPDHLVTAEALEATAGALAAFGDHEDAARLFGSAERLRCERGLVRWASEEPRYQTDLALVREALGDEAFTNAWAAGAAQSAADAVGYATRGRGSRGRRPSSGWRSLTPTELKVAKLVAEGLTNPQIGERLFISPGTVKTHLAHIFAKLGMSTRSELASEGTRRGI